MWPGRHGSCLKSLSTAHCLLPTRSKCWDQVSAMEKQNTSDRGQLCGHCLTGCSVAGRRQSLPPPSYPTGLTLAPRDGSKDSQAGGQARASTSALPTLVASKGARCYHGKDLDMGLHSFWVRCHTDKSQDEIPIFFFYPKSEPGRGPISLPVHRFRGPSSLWP